MNVEKLQQVKINEGTDDEEVENNWIPVTLSIEKIEIFYPEDKNFTKKVYFIIEGTNNTYYRWMFDVEELLEISPLVKNCYYSLIRNLKLTKIIENKFYRYNLEKKKITRFKKIFFRRRVKRIMLSKVKAAVLEKTENKLTIFRSTIKNNLPQIWISYVTYDKKAAYNNELSLSDGEKIKDQAINDAWRSAERIEDKLGTVKLKLWSRIHYKRFFKKEKRMEKQERLDRINGKS